jgi:MoxR-like ATPase
MTMTVAQGAALTDRLIRQVERAIVGKRLLLKTIVVPILVPGGHVLLKDYPGLARTLIANGFSTALGIVQTVPVPVLSGVLAGVIEGV